jgi:hypothetical protein
LDSQIPEFRPSVFHIACCLYIVTFRVRSCQSVTGRRLEDQGSVPSEVCNFLFTAIRRTNCESLPNLTGFLCKWIDVVCILIYLLTPWSRVLLEKLTGSKLVTKSPAFYGTRRFITEYTNARHLFLIAKVVPKYQSWSKAFVANDT